jgi:DNA ligase-1
MFDAPGHDGGFEARLEVVQLVMEINRPLYAVAHPHIRCRNSAHLQDELARIETLGGEGLMLRQPGARYVAGRSQTLLKVKNFQDAEALVIGHEPGRGRHQGRLGALLVEMANGIRFAVGSGLTDAQRDQPPVVGSIIRFRYQELTDSGVPRFPTYLGLRPDMPCQTLSNIQGEVSMASESRLRRFEYAQGSSNKFWEIDIRGREVTVHFGRIGTTGQRETKSFGDPAAARKHAAKKIDEKVNKGYIEAR